MTDITLTINEGVFDLIMSGPDLDTDEGLETAVLVSLFTDRRATVDDDLPGVTDDRRGWWGDEGRDKIGSKLWLLSRSKNLASVVEEAREYCQAALQWLIDRDVAQKVDVVTEAQRKDLLAIQVTVYRKDGSREAQSYSYMWRAV